VDAIMKQSGTKVPCSNDFSGSGHTQEVTTTSVIVAIVQDSINFIDGETSSKDGIDPLLVKNVLGEEVSGTLMMNASMIISREVRSKLMCMKLWNLREKS
jgi:hypothetical protein